ncbi:RHS repeat-associated core domain-containing protein [Kribbella sp. NPDC051770]|uniref:RHS repeat-associated core domain-containing protein n=1 Tax=Kribbella sp. NPDC051770 TaxID=3155413 RepID=UPI003429AE28
MPLLGGAVRRPRMWWFAGLGLALAAMLLSPQQSVTAAVGPARTGSTSISDVLPQPDYNPVAVSNQTATVPAGATPIGGTAGTFDVGETGEAQYEVPLQVVPGRGGFQPNLSLSYRSGGGNSQLGKGFILSGLAQISRCAKSLLDDNVVVGVQLDSTDRFCLGGKKLIAISGPYGANGTEYRTKPDTHVRVRSYKSDSGSEGPTNFTVWLPDGTVQQYGLIGESTARVYLDGSSGYYVNTAWNLAKATDRSGNVITYSYGVQYRSAAVTSEVERWISRIAYGHGATLDREVTFGYSTRPDRLLGFAFGERREGTRRLTSITMSADRGGIPGWQQARSYILEYTNTGATKASKLLRLKECGTVAAECKRATTFSWSDGTEGFQPAENQTSAAGAPIVPPSDESQLIAADFTGDGRTDLAWPEGKYSTGEVYRWKHADATILGKYSIVHDGVEQGDGRSSKAYAIDYDNDGRMDLLPRESYNPYRPILSRPNGVHRRALTSFYGGLNRYNTYPEYPGGLLGDFDGDGYQDVLEYVDPPESPLPDYRWTLRRRTGELNPKIDNTGPVTDPGTAPYDDKAFTDPVPVSWLNNTAPSDLLIADFDGDGRDELLWKKNPSGDLTLADPTVATAGLFREAKNLKSSLLSTEHLLLDANGDGLLDVLYAGTGPSGLKVLYQQLNTGHGFTLPETTFLTVQPGALKAAEVLDYDDNGSQDALVPHWSGSAYMGMDLVRTAVASNDVLAWTRTEGVVTFAPRSVEALQKEGVRVVDVDGDGKDDLLMVDRPAGGGPAALRLWRHTGSGGVGSASVMPAPDLLRGFTEGDPGSPGTKPKTVEISYSTLADPTVYQPGVCTRTPYQVCSSGAKSVVKQVLTDAGLNDNPAVRNTATYTYRTGRVDKRSRAFLGFAEIEILTKSGLVTQGPELRRTFYSNKTPQLDPRPVEAWTVNALADAKFTLRRTTLGWQERPTVGGSAFPYVGETKERTYEYALASCVPCHGAWTPSYFDGLGKAAHVTNTRTVSGMDEYGNAKYLVSESTDAAGLATTTTTEVVSAVDAGEWLISRPGKVITTDTRHEGIDASRTRVTSYEYKPQTQLVSKRTVSGASIPAGNTLSETFDHDAEGNVIRVRSTDEKTGEVVQATAIYDPYGYPHATMNELGHINRTGHDQVTGLRKTTVDLNGLRTDLTYDSLGKLVKSRQPSGAETTTSYSVETVGAESLQKVRIADGTGGVSELVADRLGRPVLERFKGLDGVMRETETRYDGYGHPVSRTIPRSAGAAVAEKITSTYDDLGRLTSQKNPDGGIQSWSYDKLNVAYSDAGKHKRQISNNSRGEMLRVTDGVGTAAETSRKYSYGPFGTLTQSSVEGVSGSMSSFTYDALGHQLTSKDPEQGTTLNTVNAFGEVVDSTDAIGRVTSFKRDSIRRVVERTVTQNGAGRSHTSYFYDSSTGSAPRQGKLLRTTMYDGGHYTAISNTYDNLSRLATVDYTLPAANSPQDEDVEESFRVGYSYDANNRVTSVRYPALPGQAVGNKVAYEYGANGRLRAARLAEPVVDATALWTAKETDGQDRVVRQESGDGAVATRALDWQGAVRNIEVKTSILDADPERQLFSEDYTYDAVGNLIDRTRDVAGQPVHELFGYDALDRISSQAVSHTSASGPPIVQQTDTWAYDKLGNTTTSKRRGSYTYDSARPTLVKSVTGGIFGNRSYGYDAVGNQTTRPDGAVTYNDFNLPSKIASAQDGDSTFLYYPNGERARKVTSKQTVTSVPGLYERRVSGAQTEHRLLVQADGATVAALVYSQAGPAGVTRKQPLYLHADRQGSVSVVTADDDAPGFKATVKEHRSYDAFGKPRNADWRLGDAGYTEGIEPAVVDQGYTGHEDDRDTELVNMGGRIYDPTLARFLTADPNVDGANPTQAWNGYAYVANNPLRYTDPSGFASCLAHCTLPDHVWSAMMSSQMFWNAGTWGISPLNPDSPEGGKRFEREMERYYQKQYDRDFGSDSYKEAEPTTEGADTPEDTLRCVDGLNGPQCTGVGVAPEKTIVPDPPNDWGHSWCGPGLPCGLDDQTNAEAWAHELDDGMDALLVQIGLNVLDALSFGRATAVEVAEEATETGLVLLYSGGKKIPPSALAGAAKAASKAATTPYNGRLTENPRGGFGVPDGTTVSSDAAHRIATKGLGYNEAKAPFDSHGALTYRGGNGPYWISPDNTGHLGGVFKGFDRAGQRIGTYTVEYGATGGANGAGRAVTGLSRIGD